MPASTASGGGGTTTFSGVETVNTGTGADSITGNQAVQMARAGLRAIYLSGWQVAADGNSAAQTYPDQSLYPADSVPNMVRRLNRALQRADQIERAEGGVGPIGGREVGGGVEPGVAEPRVGQPAAGRAGERHVRVAQGLRV